MPPNSYSSTNRQVGLGTFDNTSSPAPATSFDSPPIPSDQESLELRNPIETLDLLNNPTSEVREWLSFIQHQYQPPSERDVLLLYPCAGEKPMCNSDTYQALWKTLDRYSESTRRRIHVVTVSEPMGLIPFEFQNGEFVYDCPGLFGWWCKEHDEPWDTTAQERCLTILGDAIGGFLSRATSNGWYDTTIACVRHVTAKGNLGSDQTHRRMLERAESLSDSSLMWLPPTEVVTTLTDEVNVMAWQMSGVSHPAIQSVLADHLDAALDIE
jgi:hypothetical protein